MSHAFFAAYDRADERAVNAVLVEHFVFFDAERVIERDAVLTKLESRRQRNAPERTRTYGVERSWIGASSAIFRSEAVEHLPPDGAAASGDFSGAHTLIWASDGGAWKVVSMHWSKVGVGAAQDKWNEVYREGSAFRNAPNEFLSEMVAGIAPGSALDVGCGQGRNALFLAELGWDVTAIDIADEGVRQTRTAAQAHKLKVTAITADMDSWDYGVSRWDLITSIYVGFEAKHVPALRASLKPAGLLVLESFHVDANPNIGTTPEMLSHLFAEGFEIVRNEVALRVSDWGNQRGLPEKVVLFAARKK